VIEAVDGDTLRVRADIWPGISARSLVRLRGIDAPELRGKCPGERAAARAARAALALLAGDRVALSAIAPDKYSGRVLARVATPDGRDLAQALVALGHARPYGGGKRSPWCPE
jgi:endonuclease YncB( thermonuclease family)